MHQQGGVAFTIVVPLSGKRVTPTVASPTLSSDHGRDPLRAESIADTPPGPAAERVNAAGLAVFVSYTHDSELHRKRVLELAQRLRDDGLRCEIDQFVNGSPDEGWPLWTERCIERSQFVLVVCTDAYHRRYESEGAPGVGLGGRWETVLTRQDLYETTSAKFVPVTFSDGAESPGADGSDPRRVIPKSLRRFTHHSLPSGYDGLLRFLTGQARVVPVPVRDQKEMPSESA